MTALVPSVYITNNYNKIRDYFLGQRSPNIQNLTSDDQSLFITPQNNRYLESFEMSYNIEKSERDCLTLVIVDTDGEFEKKLIGFNLDVAKRKVAEEYNKSLKKQLENINASLTTISQEVNKANQIYVAFGTGENFVDWSEPKVFRLASTKVDVSNNGLRKYTLGFVPSYYSIFRPKLIFNLEKANPESEFFHTRNITNVFGTLPTKSNYAPNKPYDSLSQIIYSVVRNYVNSVTGEEEQNIIGIIPELDIKLNNKEFKEILNQCGIDIKTASTLINAYGSQLSINSYLTPSPGATTAQQQSNASTSSVEYYVMEATSPNKAELNPKYPDFYEPLNKLNIYIRSKLNLTDNFVLIEENDCRVLEFFKNKGLINNAASKCIIFGMEKMIYTLLYNDYSPGDEIGDTDQVLNKLGVGPVTKFPLAEWGDVSSFPTPNPLDPFKEYVKLQDTNYAKEFILWVSKRRSNSNFSENYSLDELAISDKSKQVADAYNSEVIRQLFKDLSIPIFTNNLKNSNILELQLLNSENYLEGLNISVNTNFARFFLSNINNNLKQINLGTDNLDSVLAKTNEIIDRIFSQSQATKLLDELEYEYFAYQQSGNIPSNLSDKIKEEIEKRSNLQRYEDFKILLKEIFIKFYTQLNDDQIDYLNSYVKTTSFYQTILPKKTQRNEKFRTLLITLLNNNNEFEKLFLGYERLFVANKGNLDLDALLIAYAKLELGNDVDINLYNSIVDAEGNLATDLQFHSRQRNTTRQQLKNLLDIRSEKVSQIYQYASIINSLFVKETNKKTGIQFSPKKFGLGQDEILADLYQALAQRSWKVSIKTLPFFYLSNPRLISFKPCFLFSKKLNLIGDPKQNELDYFSGIYNITSFKHVINTKEAYSEFILIKRAFNSSLV